MALASVESGQGAPVVLLHGFPLDHTLWDGQAAAFSPGFRIITPDLPGHGNSPILAGLMTVDRMADSVIALLEELNITEPVTLGGLSMGGYVALSVAARYPERLRALMLFDTKSAADTPAAAALREKNARAIDETGSTEDFLRGMLPKLFADSTRRNAPEVVAETEAIMRRSLPEGVSATLRALASRPDRTEILAKIAVPTLVVVGEEDAISPPEEMKRMAEMIPRCRFSVIPHAGHLSPLENPSAVNLTMGTFLDELGP